MKKKKDSKRLNFAITAHLIAKVPEFFCSVKHNLYLGPDVQWNALIVQIPSLSPNNNPDDYAFFDKLSVIHTVQVPYAIKRKSLLNKELSALSRIIKNYQLTKSEHENLKTLLFPKINPRVNHSFGSILKKILKKAGYTVSIELTDSHLSSHEGDSKAIQSEPVKPTLVDTEAKPLSSKTMLPCKSNCRAIIPRDLKQVQTYWQQNIGFLIYLDGRKKTELRHWITYCRAEASSAIAHGNLNTANQWKQKAKLSISDNACLLPE